MDLEMLNKKIRDSGMTMVAISSKIGITRETLYNKINGIVEFKASEIQKLSNVLGLSEEDRNHIFFTNNVN